MPEISVIMGVYNCKDIRLLKKSVSSIINQTFTDWEFIICNDGSTDNTLNILKNIEKMDSRIRIISYETNMGLANALNHCINVARGNYIARQDDDDTSVSTRFEKQIAAFRDNPNIAIVGTFANVVDDNGVWGQFIVDEKPKKTSFLWTNPFAHPTVMMKKDALVGVGGYRVSKETRRCEDYDLFMRMYAAGYSGINLTEKLYNYRIINDHKKHRPMKYRIDEAVVRAKGYRILKLYPKGIVYICKPIIIGLIPQSVFKRIRKKQY